MVEIALAVVLFFNFQGDVQLKAENTALKERINVLEKIVDANELEVSKIQSTNTVRRELKNAR